MGRTVGVSPVASVTGYQFASAGTRPAGDVIFVDDVTVADGSGTAPKPPQPLIKVGRPMIIDETGGSTQGG
jgi:hypothetical protein